MEVQAGAGETVYTRADDRAAALGAARVESPRQPRPLACGAPGGSVVLLDANELEPVSGPGRCQPCRGIYVDVNLTSDCFTYIKVESNFKDSIALRQWNLLSTSQAL